MDGIGEEDLARFLADPATEEDWSFVQQLVDEAKAQRF
jgi:hypothetical protein